ncbi:Rv3235 family protein [Schaalia suimastitidis]|uniref:Rv3235 family protein n=1 Tax=Schaalia suimastitidis TaxID=121163 RepID=UPI0003F62A49|nr:Rv3235 family protein [Schaalia suimastitidis]
MSTAVATPRNATPTSRPFRRRQCLRWDGSVADHTRPPRPRHTPLEVLEILPDASGLPAAKQWASNLARGITEVLSGTRPILQLQRWLSTDLYEHLTQLTMHLPEQTKVVPMRATNCLICDVRDGVVEAAVIVACGPHSRIVGLRLENRHQRWVATALDIA